MLKARDLDGYCPLGRALNASIRTPGPWEVAMLIIGHGMIELGDVHRPMMIAAREFIGDWDNGRITDLAAALGVAL